MSLGVHYIWTSSVHGPLLRVPAMELSIPILLFSLFWLKISIYQGVMMFEQYGHGILILSLNQLLIPSLLPVTVHLVLALPLVWILLQPWQTVSSFSCHLVYLHWWPYWLSPQFLLIFDHGAICNVHPLVLFGSYSKWVLKIPYTRLTSTRGILFSSISGDSWNWGGCRIRTLQKILWLHP